MTKLINLLEEYNSTVVRRFVDMGFMQRNPYVTHISKLPHTVKTVEASKILSHGDSAVAILLPDDTVLKLGQSAPAQIRPFDAPILREGVFESGFISKRRFPTGINYIIQPLVQICKEKEEFSTFESSLPSQFSFLSDAKGPHQIGYFQDKIVLVDYESVVPYQ